MRTRLLAAAVWLLVLGAGAPILAAPPTFIPPSKQEKCSVCGMFVAKYPEWVVELVYADGSHTVFDGVRDLVRFLADMRGFGSTKRREDVAAVFVMDYYSLEPIDGAAAFYVLGSDVHGPMGRELIPFEKEEEARGFLRDHHGTRILRFPELSEALPALLD
jgi:nitrous oxide reductase accessory protein NosL